MSNQLTCDMHVHTRFSCDSEAGMEAYCLRALQLGVTTVCFTDHVDHNPRDYGFGYYDADAYFEELRLARERFGGRLTLLAGLEFSEPHVYPEEFEEYVKLPYDFIIGSVHYWHEDLFPSEMTAQGVPVDVCYRGYWREVRRAVEFGGFDCLGHIDFPKRYYGELLYDEAEILEIMSLTVDNGICLEVNTSSLRKGLAEPMPGRGILELYRAAGGIYATVGSDAHRPEDLAAGRETASELLSIVGLHEVTYAGRKPEPLV